MKLRTQFAAAAALLTAGLFAPSSRAQVVSALDEHGHRVFINAETVKIVPAARTSSAHGAPANRTLLAVAAASNRGTAVQPELTAERLNELIKVTAERHNVNPELVRAVIKAESNGNPQAVSRKGALGLMQLMPSTAMELGVKDVFSPQDNLDAGVRYLRSLLQRYNGDLDRALAAYNAGAGAVDRARGVPRYRETQDYVKKITKSYRDASQAAAHPIYRTTDAQGRVVWTND
jgi:soluble lytic murein transglycosylase-like protein